MTNWKPDERTVRACIEALRKCDRLDHRKYNSATMYSITPVVALMTAERALEALLTDQAEEMVREWVNNFFESSDGDAVYWDDDMKIDGSLKAFARWLINTGKIAARPTTSERNDHE